MLHCGVSTHLPHVGSKQRGAWWLILILDPSDQAVRQTVRILSMDNPQGILRTGDRATVEFEFMTQPEFIKPGMKLLFREGKTKVSPMVQTGALMSIRFCRFFVPRFVPIRRDLAYLWPLLTYH